MIKAFFALIIRIIQLAIFIGFLFLLFAGLEDGTNSPYFWGFAAIGFVVINLLEWIIRRLRRGA